MVRTCCFTSTPRDFYTPRFHHVRLGRWGWGDDAFADLRPKGWWSPRDAISEEELGDERHPTHWAPFDAPSTEEWLPAAAQGKQADPS